MVASFSRGTALSSTSALGDGPAHERWWLAVIAERRCWPPRDDRVEVDKVPICIALNLSAAVATRVVDATRPARGRAGVESREGVLATSLEFLATHPSPPLPSLPHGGAGEIDKKRCCGAEQDA